MTVKLSPASILAFIAGIAALVLFVSGRDMSPSKAVADSPHSVVNMAASQDVAWQANRSTLRSPDPSQVTVVRPPAVNVVVNVPSSPTGGTAEVSGASGWRTPDPALVQAAAEQAAPDHPGSYNCMKTADEIVSYGWTGSASEVSCFGSEDNLAGINDAYGALEEGRSSYEPSEQAQGSRFAMPQEDGSVFDPASYPACASDDGSGPRPCFWDASRMGNGQGTSFFVAANGRVTSFN